MIRIIRVLAATTAWGLMLVGLVLVVMKFTGYKPEIANLDTISQINSKAKTDTAKNNEKEILLKIALIADSHIDLENLKKTVEEIKEDKPDFIIGLGDYSAVGTREELFATKEILDKSKLKYYVIPGDHDLWDSRNKDKDPLSNFKYVFGKDYQQITEKEVNFLLVNNADNYRGVDSNQMTWLLDKLKQTKNYKLNLIFIHKPLYHPTSIHIMGQLSKQVDEQRKQLLDESAKTEVAEIFSGDLHFFNHFEEPQTHDKITIVGAVTAENNWQGPRYSVLKIYKDYTYDVGDKSIK